MNINHIREIELYLEKEKNIKIPEKIIKLNERKVQLVNMPLNYNLKNKQIKKYILQLMLEKDKRHYIKVRMKKNKK